MLVHTVGPEKGSGRVVGSQGPLGSPAFTHASIAAISASVAGGFGVGGIAAIAVVIRASATSAYVFEGSLLAGAARSARVRSGIGTPGASGLPWQSMHLLASSSAMSQGSSLASLPPPP